MNGPVVVLDRVTKRFAGHTAVDGLSLAVPRGVIFGLLGPNGAGKTTSIRMIMDILEPDEGEVRLFGERGAGRDHSARIGYLPEERGLYPKMRVLDVLVFLAEVKGVSRSVARPKAQDWLERLGLGDWRLHRVNELSKGMQQKVQFISTMLHDPELVILDEPFSGLDPVNAQVMKDTVLDLRRRGKTIVFSTHIMEQAEKLCDELCIIARGKKLVDGALGDIKRTRGGHHLVIGFDGSPGAAQQVFAERGLVKRVDDYGQYAELELAPGADAQIILQRLVASGARLSRFELMEPSLHKIFLDLVGPEASHGASFRHIEELSGVLGRLAVTTRLERAGVNPSLVNRAQLRIDLRTRKISGSKTTGETSAQSFGLAYAMAIILFVVITIYGVNVMSSVLEEKTTRIVEVLVSSLRPFQLMLGKVVGVGAVSIFQFLIWVVGGAVVLSQAGTLVGDLAPPEATAQQAAFQLPNITAATIVVFLTFFLGGFFLYSAMFAAVGAISSNEQEARQAQQPVMFLLMIAYLSVFALSNNPGSTYAVALSLIPFTAPIAMPVRWAVGNLTALDVIPSLALLVGGTVLVTWVAARIYRVGILITGKRPNLKELLRWIRTA